VARTTSHPKIIAIVAQSTAVSESCGSKISGYFEQPATVCNWEKVANPTMAVDTGGNHLHQYHRGGLVD